jgi:hypothetical protein
MMKSSYTPTRPRKKSQKLKSSSTPARPRKKSQKSKRKLNLAPFFIGFALLCVLGYLYLSVHRPILIHLP